MTIQRITVSLRRFGLKGVWDWILRFINPPSNTLLESLQAHIDPKVTPMHGITIIGDLLGQHSLDKVLRDFAASLRLAKIPFQTIDTMDDIPADLVLNRYSHIVSNLRDYPLRWGRECYQHRIVFWEFDTGLTELMPELIDGSPLIVFSDFCYASIRRQVARKTKVVQIRYPFHFDSHALIPGNEIRNWLNIPSTSFVVFFNFDYKSCYYRKNPEGLLTAFIEAFASKNDCYLVFKTNSRDSMRSLSLKIEKIANESCVASRVRFVNDYLSENRLVSLTASCDVYASLHRGEGFGLGMAEAMSMGKAVVATNYGANLEFCKPDNSELIPYKTVPIRPDQRDHAAYTYVTHWPEPDIHAAAQALRKLYDDPDYRNTLGRRAQAFIKNYYSIENFKKSMDAFFNS